MAKKHTEWEYTAQITCHPRDPKGKKGYFTVSVPHVFIKKRVACPPPPSKVDTDFTTGRDVFVGKEFRECKITKRTCNPLCETRRDLPC